MTITVDAVFRNGVFVPSERPALAEDERVRLVIEPVTVPSGSGTLRPSAAGNGRSRPRIKLDPALARAIATSPEFHPDGT
jgi:hypothetical protein